VLGRVSASRGTIQPLPASNFFKASVAAAAARGVDGRVTDAEGGAVPASRATNDEDKPPADETERPLRLLGRLLLESSASMGAAEGAGGESSSFRREIPSGKLRR
jgi:hypothetical protein